MKKKFHVTLLEHSEGVSVSCPELPGCQSQGDTFEEIMANIREAAELYLETLPRAAQRKLSKKQILTTAMEVSVA